MNKVTFSITYHEGLGNHCGNYETQEALRLALRKIGKSTAEGYNKTDVCVNLNGSVVWKGQLEPDHKMDDTDIVESLTRWIDWYSSEPCENYITPEKAQEHARLYRWLLSTILLWST